MQMRAIVLVLSCAAWSLTLTALSSASATPQAQEERAAEAKQSSSRADADVKKMTTTSKIARGPEAEPFESSHPGLQGLGKRFLEDQEQIWTSPAKIRFSDTQWLVPVSGLTAGLFVTDRDFSKHLSQNPTTISHYKTLSNAGVGALIGGAGGMWLLGHVRHNEHWSETGFLAGEAAINSLVAVETLKYYLGRQRPFQGNGTGPFFHRGTSFPSEHSAAAWSIAGVVAHEYPGPLMKIMAYGLASLVDYSRIRGRQHFPSDVLVGSIMGNLIAQNVYSRHHDPGLGGGEWRSISQIFRGYGNSSPANQGSPYVPLDSWIYPAFDRLAALGYVDSGFLGMRPWTRLECARLLNEAGESFLSPDSPSEAAKTYFVLAREFAGDFKEMSEGKNRTAKLESVYASLGGIAGQPLTDAYHFGETVVNDYGRPYQEGFNFVDGFSGWMTSGHWVGYVRGEFQHASSAPALSDSARQYIFSSNNVPSVPPDIPIPSVNRFKLLDAYVGLNFSNWQITFGPQTLWWGPSRGGPLMFNDNAPPVNMLRVNRVSPFKLPSFLGWLGPLRMEWFLGQLAGHEFVFQTNTGIVGQFGQPIGRQPFIDGAKFSFKPLRNFELGFSVTSVFAGGPTPLTAHTFLQSYSLGNGSGALDPGDRRSGLDFTFRVPGLQDWLTFYTEAFVEDELSPIAYWRNSAIWSGLYLPQIPKLNKLDLRVEGGYTDLPGNLQSGLASNPHYNPGIFYTNTRYPNGYTNDGQLLGNWMGRQSTGAQAWTTYRFSPRNFIQLGFRHQKVSQQVMPGGATLTDFSVSADFWPRADLSVSSSVQYERWLFPVIGPGADSNVATSVKFTFWPHKGK